MKLLTKINYKYLLFSGILLILFGAVSFIALYITVSMELDENLHKTKKRVVNYIRNDKPIPELIPYIEVKESPSEDIKKEQYYNEKITIKEKKRKKVYRTLAAIEEINGQKYDIKIRELKLESEDLLETTAVLIFSALLLFLISMFIINTQISKSIWIPFYNNLIRIKKFSINNNTPIKLEYTNITEFDGLNNVVTELTEKVISDYFILKRFTEDASHELQSPLAVIRAKLEALLNNNNLNENQIESINAITKSVHRLTKLNKNLITLSKVENQLFNTITSVNITNILKEQLEEFKELIQLMNMNVIFNVENDITINIDKTLADILITNLISNSIKHNISGGSIEITTNENEITIANKGLSAIKNPEKIFDRFYKESDNSGNVGLGLSIVKNICDNNSISINYMFEDNKHIFKLSFKT